MTDLNLTKPKLCPSFVFFAGMKKSPTLPKPQNILLSSAK
jgi:hypothetical protein